MDTRDTKYVCIYVRARTHAHMRTHTKNEFFSATCPCVPNRLKSLQGNGFRVGHVAGTRRFWDTLTYPVGASKGFVVII